VSHEQFKAFMDECPFVSEVKPKPLDPKSKVFILAYACVRSPEWLRARVLGRLFDNDKAYDTLRVVARDDVITQTPHGVVSWVILGAPDPKKPPAQWGKSLDVQFWNEARLRQEGVQLATEAENTLRELLKRAGRL
jgi:hypothetical protein